EQDRDERDDRDEHDDRARSGHDQFGARSTTAPHGPNAAVLPAAGGYDLAPQVTTALGPQRRPPAAVDGESAVRVPPAGAPSGRYGDIDPQGYRWKVLKWRIVP
ncbi:MAG: hypothetical protein D6725_13465, partial [Planctomycetota bacterium]